MSWRSRPSIPSSSTIPIYGWTDDTLIPARPAIFIAHVVFLHCPCESCIEVDVERVRQADGNEDEIAELVGDVAELLARLRFREAGTVAEGARPAAEVPRRPA